MSQPTRTSLQASADQLSGNDTIRIDPMWFEICQIQDWKARCKNTHGEKCNSRLQAHKSAWSGPKWLIDCKQQCLVPGTPSRSYVALSYVWGNVEPFYLTKANLKALQVPSALASDLNRARLPASIKDAIALTRLLGELYIWIDCLCIVQDDLSAKQADILSMAAIFSNAFLTIVLADEYADHGIRGIHGVSASRNYKQTLREAKPGIFVIQSIESQLMAPEREVSVWNMRGWTFQEDLFSCRKLIFEDETVRWECRHARYFEDVHMSEGDLFEEGSYWDDRSLGESYPSMPASWQMLFRDYSTRHLTYPEDSHDAISSTLSNLGKTFKGGFISGIPVLNFDVGLLWQPERPLSLRIGKSTGLIASPTWSWLAWQGELHEWCWYRGADFLLNEKHPLTEIILKGLDWHIVEDAENGILSPVINEQLRYEATYSSHDVAPPDGWTRHDKTSPRHGPDVELKVSRARRIYKHHLIPKLEFRYPIPMPDPTAPPTEPRLVKHIVAGTSQAKLYCGERIPGWQSGHYVFALRDEHGNFAGSFRPNEWPFLDNCEAHVDYGSEHGALWLELCLAELSLGQAREDSSTEYNIDEWSHPARKQRDIVYEFYNVMWVDWCEGVAYRRGLGRVERSFWESLEREEVVLILG